MKPEQVFWFPRAGVNAIKLSQGEHAGRTRRANTQVRPYNNIIRGVW
jgi:hypothetical protein